MADWILVFADVIRNMMFSYTRFLVGRWATSFEKKIYLTHAPEMGMKSLDRRSEKVCIIAERFSCPKCGQKKITVHLWNGKHNVYRHVSVSLVKMTRGCQGMKIIQVENVHMHAAIGHTVRWTKSRHAVAYRNTFHCDIPAKCRRDVRKRSAYCPRAFGCRLVRIPECVHLDYNVIWNV